MSDPAILHRFIWAMIPNNVSQIQNSLWWFIGLIEQKCDLGFRCENRFHRYSTVCNISLHQQGDCCIMCRREYNFGQGTFLTEETGKIKGFNIWLSAYLHWKFIVAKMSWVVLCFLLEINVTITYLHRVYIYASEKSCLYLFSMFSMLRWHISCILIFNRILDLPVFL